MKKEILAVALACVMAVSGGAHTTTAATKKASKSDKRKYKGIYKAFLEQGSFTFNNRTGSSSKVKMASFLLLDIDKNGVPELIVKSSQPRSSAGMDNHYVFTVRSGKLVSCGYYTARSVSYVRYRKKYHALYNDGWINSVGGTYAQLYKISGKKLKECRYASSMQASPTSSKMKYRYGNSSAKAKKVSKKKFKSYCKKYLQVKQTKKYKFVYNSEYERNKKLR